MNLRAALAGMETMLEYGVMKEWDQRTRAWEREHRRKKEVSPVLAEEIILEARILAVADVVEAMSSHRPFRPALGIDKALEEVSGNRSVLYDPNVVDACLKVFTEKGFEFE